MSPLQPSVHVPSCLSQHAYLGFQIWLSFGTHEIPLGYTPLGRDPVEDLLRLPSDR